MADFGEIFLLRFLISGLLMPVFKIVCKVLQEYIRNTYGETSKMLNYINKFIPFALRPYKKCPENWDNFVIPTQAFRAENFMIDVMTDIAIVLSFGVIFPPLAIVGCFSIGFATIFAQLMLGRLVTLARVQTDLVEVVEKINEECIGVHAVASKGLVPLSMVLSIFWAYFLFDILGDQVGYQKALPLLVTMVVIPILIFAVNKAYGVWFCKQNVAEPLPEIELQTCISVANPILLVSNK